MEKTLGQWLAVNRRLAKKRVQCLNEALCFVSSSVLADSLVLRNQLLRQVPNRCVQVTQTVQFLKVIIFSPRSVFRET